MSETKIKIAFPHMAGVFSGLFRLNFVGETIYEYWSTMLLLLLLCLHPPLRTAKYLQQYFIDSSDRRWVCPAAWMWVNGWMDGWVKAFSALQFCIIFILLLHCCCYCAQLGRRVFIIEFFNSPRLAFQAKCQRQPWAKVGAVSKLISLNFEKNTFQVAVIS